MGTNRTPLPHETPTAFDRTLFSLRSSLVQNADVLPEIISGDFKPGSTLDQTCNSLRGLYRELVVQSNHPNQRFQQAYKAVVAEFQRNNASCDFLWR
jgi:hypothetical protein